MGFLGYGDIAKSTAVLAGAFGMRLIALRRNPQKFEGDMAGSPAIAATYGPDEQAAFLAECDYVVCTLPLTEQSRRSVDAASFAAMKPTAVFISLGRGAVVDEAALVEALRSRQIFGAACDVFAVEPLPTDSPLWNSEQLLLTAHNADLTEDYMPLGIGVWRRNLDCFLAGKPMATPVDTRAGY